jgi:hypothetical protein
MKKILLLLIASPLFCFSQHNHDDENHSHEDHSHNNEFAIGLGVIPEHENALGIHAHYIKGIGLNNKFGAGISFETILDDHEHHSFSLISLYRFDFGITVAYAAGILRVVEDEPEYQFSQHIELAYEIPFGELHIGPQIDIGIEEEGIHYMFGVHLGIDF